MNPSITTTSFWQKLSPITKALFVFALINILLIGLFLIIILKTPFDETSLNSTWRFLLGLGDADSWSKMDIAYGYIRHQTEHQELVYTKVFFDLKTKFQYPLTTLFIFCIKKFIPEGRSIFDVLNHFSWIFTVAMVFFVIQIFNLSMKIHSNRTESSSYKVDWITRNITLICLSLTFYPLAKSFSNGQLQTWINCLVTILFWYWIQGKKSISGILLGIICLMKPHYVILLVWGFLRKKWSFLLTSTITIALGILMSVFVFGLANNIDYFSVLSFMAKHGESTYPNQSINGLLNRLFFNGNNLGNEDKNYFFPPFNQWIYIGTELSSLLLIAIALLWTKRTKGNKGSTIDLAIAILASTMASPIAWEHHYGILLPIYAFLIPYLFKEIMIRKMTTHCLYLCIISYLLSSNYFAIFKKFAHTSFNFIQSYLLFGGLMMLFCLLTMSKYGIADERKTCQTNTDAP